MKRNVVSIISAVVMSGAFMYAQGKSGSTAPAAGSTEAGKPGTFRGCLQPGGSQGLFMLLKAAEKDGAKAKGLSFKVAPAPKVDVAAHAGQEVEITGTVSTKSDEMPTLNATKIKWTADYCG